MGAGAEATRGHAAVVLLFLLLEVVLDLGAGFEPAHNRHVDVKNDGQVVRRCLPLNSCHCFEPIHRRVDIVKVLDQHLSVGVQQEGVVVGQEASGLRSNILLGERELLEVGRVQIVLALPLLDERKRRDIVFL